MNRSDVENTLLKIGIPAKIKGFKYISDAIMLIDGGTQAQGRWTDLYRAIGEENNATISQVERSIRHAFTILRKGYGNKDIVEHYIGFCRCDNGSSLMMLYIKIKQEFGNDIKISDELDENKIRQIVREELKAIMKGIT